MSTNPRRGRVPVRIRRHHRRALPSTSSDDYAVALRFGDTVFCSATLVADNVVVTARHCVHGDAGSYYTAAAIGTAGATGNAAFRVLALGDSIVPAAVNDAGVRPLRVRLIHAAPATISGNNANGAVDVWNITGDNQAAWAPLAQNFAFGAYSGQDTAGNIEDDYLSLPPGTYRLGVDADRNGTPDVCFVAPLTTGGAIVNAFAVSAPGEDGGATTFSIIAQVTIPGAPVGSTVARIPSSACPSVSSGDAGIQDASTNG